MQDFDELAKKFIEGEWFYNASERMLKKSFGSNKELLELDLLDEEGYLNSGFKLAVIRYLGKDILNSEVQGPFGDSDIFCGSVEEEEIFYSIELYNISDVSLDVLSQIPNVVISSEMGIKTC